MISEKAIKPWAIFIKILEIDSTFVGAYVNIGFKYQEMGDPTTAIKFFNKAIELEPDEPLSYSNETYNKYKLGELNSALSDINLSIKLYPSIPMRTAQSAHISGVKA